jgi:perosamine synthetase
MVNIVFLCEEGMGRMGIDKVIPLSVPNLTPNILDALKEIIETGWVSTGGRFIQEFETKIQQYLRAQMAVSSKSGTA